MDYYNEWHDSNEKGNEIQSMSDDEIAVTEGYKNFRGTGRRYKRKFSFRTFIAAVVVSSFISCLITGGAMYYIFSDWYGKQADTPNKTNLLSQPAVDDNAISSGKSVIPLNTDISEGSSITQMAEKVGPSIVGIRMTAASQQSRIFGMGTSQSQAEGSGIIISSDGYIMTNYHVVEYADPKNQTGNNTTLEVFIPDGRQVKAAFIGGDSKNDLAVIKVDLTGLPAAELGDSSQLMVGEQVVAIGNPLGIEFAGSVTSGIVSALNRQVAVDDKVLNVIQTDAAINPGNSGGALLNTQGQIIGINTIKISVTGVEGLGFAIPVNDAKPIIDQLIMYGYVKGRPFIGISGQEITEVLSMQYNLPEGIYVTAVTPGSGAEEAGMETGDIIVSLAGREVKTIKDLDDIKQNYKAGDTVDIMIYRNKAKTSLKLTFSEEK